MAGAPDGGLRAIWQEEDPSTRPPGEPKGTTNLWYREWSPVTGWSPHIVQLFSTPGDTTFFEIAVDGIGLSHIVFTDDTGRGTNNYTPYYMRGVDTFFTAPHWIVPQ